MLTAGVPQLSGTDDEDEYGYADALSDLNSDRYEEHLDYVAARSAGSEALASQLPGRERGPADAYRHILWAAEMTRRFGEERAREILALHERDGDEQGQSADERTMDMSNNEIGIRIGVGARTFDDVTSATRKTISGSAEDGSGTWKADYDPTSTMAPQAAQWLSEERWAKNPKFEVARRYPFAAPPPQEMPTQLTNWYSNPIHPYGPDWDDGYVPDNYFYPYGGTQHTTGPHDPAMLRARDAYGFLVDRPWLRRLNDMR